MIDWKKTTSVIPDGVQTLSKMPNKHVEGVYPPYIEKGLGPFVWSEGKRYIDYPCGLGAILLGYAHPRVNEAVRKVLTTGTIFSLPHKMETELAEKIVELIPSAEMVRFLKTGSEATSAAVRIARAYTGKRDIICCGYHGWHDWYNCTTDKNKGCDTYDACSRLEFNNIAFFEKRMNLSIAAVIIEPYVYELPKDNFLQKLKDLCHKNNALLIFDEVVTGFRTKGYSAQKYFGVTPDLTCLGKAMGNGVPISCVCGKKEIMEELEGDCFVSSTFGGDLIGIAAALETIKIVQKEEVIERIWHNGQRFIDGFNKLHSFVKCIGLPPRTFFEFPTLEHKSLFWQECLKRGVLFGYAQFISYAHTPNEIDFTIDVMKHAMDIVKRYWDNPQEVLEGPVAKEAFHVKTSSS